MEFVQVLPKRRHTEMEPVLRLPKRRRTHPPRPEANREADWGSIPGDVLCLIADNMDSIENYVNLCVVCRHWYSIAADFYNLNQNPNFFAPYCMLRADPNPNSYHKSDHKSRLCTYDPDISNSKFRFCTLDPNISISKEFVLDLPEIAGKQCWGSPFGWMVTFGPADLEFSLLHPFYRATLPLPSLRSLISPGDEVRVQYNPYKAFLTTNPDSSPNNCIVLLVAHVGAEDSILAFAKPGDNVWSRIQGTSDLNDIIYFKGNLYGVRRNRDQTPVLVLIYTDGPCPRAVKLLTAGDCDKLNFSGLDLTYNTTVDYVTRRYLFNLNGKLCLVIRYVSNQGHTHVIKIFKLNLSTRKWTRVRSLGNQCLFVGNNYSFTSKAAPPHPMPFGKQVYPPDNFVSNYVFYTYDDDYTFYPQNETLWRPDEGVYRISRYDPAIFSKDRTNTYPQLWMKPSLRFRRLDEMDGPRR